ncbi:MAG: hypothetical protein JW769_01815 [Parachlamydiales bacterium]|nr:hypothetical protein [Parachlamydiales bacterium]
MSQPVRFDLFYDSFEYVCATISSVVMDDRRVIVINHCSEDSYRLFSNFFSSKEWLFFMVLQEEQLTITDWSLRREN